MSDLKPCPFCGGDANAIPSEHADDCYFMVMRNAKLNKESADCSFVFDAIEAWNRRAQPAQAGQVLTDDEIAAEIRSRGQMVNGVKGDGFMQGARWAEQSVLARVARVPMTEADIESALREQTPEDQCRDFRAGIRAAEHFHGIVGEKGGAT